MWGLSLFLFCLLFPSLIITQANAASSIPNKEQINYDTLANVQYEKKGKIAQMNVEKSDWHKQYFIDGDYYSKVHSVPINIIAKQGLGNRSHKHFFPDIKDVEAIFQNNLSHLEQAYLWRKNLLKVLSENQLPLVISEENDKTYNIAFTKMTQENGFIGAQFMMSHRYYQQKWDFVKTNQKGFAIKVTPQIT